MGPGAGPAKNDFRQTPVDPEGIETMKMSNEMIQVEWYERDAYRDADFRGVGPMAEPSDGQVNRNSTS